MTGSLDVKDWDASIFDEDEEILDEVTVAMGVGGIGSDVDKMERANTGLKAPVTPDTRSGRPLCVPNTNKSEN